MFIAKRKLLIEARLVEVDPERKSASNPDYLILADIRENKADWEVMSENVFLESELPETSGGLTKTVKKIPKAEEAPQR